MRKPVSKNVQIIEIKLLRLVYISAAKVEISGSVKGKKSF